MNKIFSLLLLFMSFIIFSFFIWYVIKNIKKRTYGTVIVLNGPSASGKSSIQKEFQELCLPYLWIKLGIDNLFDKPFPEITSECMNFWQTKNDIRWIESTIDNNQNPVITLFIGPEGEKVAYAMNSAIAAYAKNGCNIIVDYIAYKKEWIHDLKSKLRDISTCWVKINIPLDIIEKREAGRGTSPIGHARSHYDTVFWDLKYDLEINVTEKSPKQIAQIIKKHVSSKI